MKELKNTKTKFYILRPHNVYGPNMGNDHVLPELIKKLKKSKKFIKIVGDGNSSRSFIYISDAVNAILSVVSRGKKNEIYNIGRQDEHKVKNIVNILSKIMKKKVKIIEGAKHKGSVSRRVPDTSKLKFLNHKNSISFKRGLSEMVKFYN